MSASPRAAKGPRGILGVRRLVTVTVTVAALVLVSAGWAAEADAKPSRGVVHRVETSGQTYARIAEHYYGKRYLGHHLRVLNRAPEPLSPGRTLIIPTYREATLRQGQTVADFARVHLSRAGRGPYLEALHFLKSKSPRPGKSLKVPTSIRHVVRPGESLKSLALTYYRTSSARRIRLLQLFNELPTKAVRIGDVVRIPLDTDDFEHARVSLRGKLPFGSAPVEPEATTRSVTPVAAASSAKKPSAPPRRVAVQAEIEVAERLYDDGRYAQCLQFVKQALSRFDGRLRTEAHVELLRLAASSLVALDRVAEAETTFAQLRRLDGAYELDLYQTSPKILDVFDSARR